MKYVEKYTTLAEINTAITSNELGFPFTGLVTDYSLTKPLYISSSVNQVVTNLSDLNNTTYTTNKNVRVLSDDKITNIVYTSGYTNYIFTSLTEYFAAIDAGNVSYPANCYFTSNGTYKQFTAAHKTPIITDITAIAAGDYYVIHPDYTTLVFIANANLTQAQSDGCTVIGIAATTYAQISGHEGVRVMALNYANYSTPDAGSSSAQQMGWGCNTLDISTLINYESSPTDDYDGKSNTKKILAVATGESWKTASTITDTYASGYYPAAECTWRYHTAGTSQGDWYLAGYNEFLSIYANNTTINAARTNLGLSVLSTNQDYWVSAEFNEYLTWRVSFSQGTGNAENKSQSSYVLPILLVTNI